MKKIIALFVIMLAFGVNANAQQKKAPAKAAPATAQQPSNEDVIRMAAAKVFELMTANISLTEDQKPLYKGLFESKHRTLSDKTLSQERKDLLAENIERKIKSGLNSDQIAKLDSNPELLKALTH